MSDLLRQMGGYEKSKNYLAELRKIPIHEQTEDTVTWLPDLFLDYRKDNNIFENGDSVVLVGAGTTGVLMKIVEHKYTNNLYRVMVLSTGSFGPIHIDNIRHATPKEIEQGFRDERFNQ